MAKIFNLCSICLVVALLLYACKPGSATQPTTPTITQSDPLPLTSPTTPDIEKLTPSPLDSTPEDLEITAMVWAAIKTWALS
jgi:PBP1b-binding outer membrane lipoprotein LpoB